MGFSNTGEVVSLGERFLGGKASFLIHPPSRKRFPGLQFGREPRHISPEIVYPTYVKQHPDYHFYKLWKNAESEINLSTELIVIGYSFPPEDTSMIGLIYDRLIQTETTNFRPDAPVIRWLESKESIDIFINKFPIKHPTPLDINRYSPNDPADPHEWQSAYERLCANLNNEAKNE